MSEVEHEVVMRPVRGKNKASEVLTEKEWKNLINRKCDEIADNFKELMRLATEVENLQGVEDLDELLAFIVIKVTRLSEAIDDITNKS